MAYNIEAAMPVLKAGGERVTSAYGNRTIYINGTYNSNFHGGIDVISRYTGTDYIIAPARGYVTATRNSISGYSEYYASGNYVKMEHANGYTTEFYHMAKGSVVVSPGQIVEKGQVIGYMGTTGWSTGNHLHFGVRIHGATVNPEPYLLGTAALPDYKGGQSSMHEGKIQLNGVPVYISSTAATAAGRLTGTYYIWSTTQVNGRCRVTNSAENVGKTGQVTGWINTTDIRQESVEEAAPDAQAVTNHETCSRKIAELEAQIQPLQAAVSAVKSAVAGL